MGNTKINDIFDGSAERCAQSGDPQAMLIASLSGALILILLLMVIIAVMGRKSGKASENTANASAEEPKIHARELPEAAHSDSQQNSGPAAPDSAGELEQTDDFMIFKRSEFCPTAQGRSDAKL